MKSHLFPIITFALAVSTAFPASAQQADVPAPKSEYSAYSTKGFYLKPHVLGTAWTVEDQYIEIDNESGGGLGLGVGYGISDLFSVYAEWSGSTVYDNEGDGDYGLYHFDLGGRFTLGSPGNRFKVMLELAATGRVAEIRTVAGDLIRSTGPAGTVGAGIQYFVSTKVALEAALMASVGEMGEIEVNGVSIPTDSFDLQAVSSRFHLGISWWP